MNAELSGLLTLAEQVVDKAERRWSQWGGTWYEVRDDELWERFEEALHAYHQSQWKGVAL